MKNLILHPIGVIKSPYKKIKDIPIQGKFRQDVEAWLELEDKYAEGLKDLEKFSHAILLYYLHKSDKENILGKPFLEDVEHGIFAIRSPHRPNHIGLTIVKIKCIKKNKLYFTNVDMLDGTPLLDIKPYIKYIDSKDDAISGWIEKHFKNGELQK